MSQKWLTVEQVFAEMLLERSHFADGVVMPNVREYRNNGSGKGALLYDFAQPPLGPDRDRLAGPPSGSESHIGRSKS